MLKYSFVLDVFKWIINVVYESSLLQKACIQHLARELQKILLSWVTR